MGRKRRFAWVSTMNWVAFVLFKIVCSFSLLWDSSSLLSCLRAFHSPVFVGVIMRGRVVQRLGHVRAAAFCCWEQEWEHEWEQEWREKRVQHGERKDCPPQYYQSAESSTTKVLNPVLQEYYVECSKIAQPSITRMPNPVLQECYGGELPNSRWLPCKTHGGCLTKLTVDSMFPAILLLQNFGVSCLASQNPHALSHLLSCALFCPPMCAAAPRNQCFPKRGWQAQAFFWAKEKRLGRVLPKMEKAHERGFPC